MKDYQITITIKNGRIISHMRRMGIDSINELCRRLGGQSGSEMGRLINMKLSPYNPISNRWRPLVIRLADFFGVLPDELFPDMAYQTLPTNKIYRLIDQQEINARLPPPSFEDNQVKTLLLEGAVSTLPKGERDVIRLRYYDGLTLAEIGDTLGLSSERIRQLEYRGLRKMRGPVRRAALEELDYE